MVIFFRFCVKMTLANNSNSVILVSLIYPSYLGLWPEDEGCSGLLSFLVLFSFLFLSALPERRHPRLCPKPTLRPYSCFCLLAAASLQPFQGSCRLSSLSGRGSEPCWDQRSSELTGEPPAPA